MSGGVEGTDQFEGLAAMFEEALSPAPISRGFQGTGGKGGERMANRFTPSPASRSTVSLVAGVSHGSRPAGIEQRAVVVRQLGAHDRAP